MSKIFSVILLVGLVLVNVSAVAQTPTPKPSSNPSPSPYTPTSMPDIYIACYNSCISSGGAVSVCYDTCFGTSSCDGVTSTVSSKQAQYDACVCMYKHCNDRAVDYKREGIVLGCKGLDTYCANMPH